MLNLHFPNLNIHFPQILINIFIVLLENKNCLWFCDNNYSFKFKIKIFPNNCSCAPHAKHNGLAKPTAPSNPRSLVGETTQLQSGLPSYLPLHPPRPRTHRLWVLLSFQSSPRGSNQFVLHVLLTPHGLYLPTWPGDSLQTPIPAPCRSTFLPSPENSQPRPLPESPLPLWTAWDSLSAFSAKRKMWTSLSFTSNDQCVITHKS